MPPNSISEYLFFKIFLEGACPDPLALYALHADCALCSTGSLCVYMGSYIFSCTQKCPEILPEQTKIASSAPDARGLWGHVLQEIF